MKSRYQASLEDEVEQARRKAQRFFRRLLKEAHQLPRTKVLQKAPAALAAIYALFVLMDTPEGQEPVALVAMLGTIRRLCEAEIERARPNTHKGSGRASK